MPTYERRENGWRVKIRLAGLPSESASFDTKAQSVAWALAREKELRETRKGNILPRSLGQAIDRYLIEVAPTHRGSRYEALRLHALRGDGKGDPLPPLPVHKLLDEVTVADMTTWQRARLAQVKPATVLREINLLRSVFESARRDWQWCRGNPIKDVRKPPKPPPRRRVISQDELRRLLLALGYDGKVEREGHQVAVCLLLALETAMRAGEMLGLTWGAVHLDQRFVTLPETKNGEARDVPLSRRAVELIELMAGADPARVFTLSSASLDALFRRARDRCGIVDLHFHDSRATALTRLSERLDVLELARMVGHRDLKSLMVYYRKTAAQLAYKLG